jgi:hypothetical protein
MGLRKYLGCQSSHVFMARCVNVTTAILCTIVFLSACDNKGTERGSSSGVFFAPVVPQDSSKHVETVVARIDIARASNASPQPSSLDPDKVVVPPSNAVAAEILNTFVLGKVGALEYVLYERNSTTLLRVDLGSSNPLNLNNAKSYLFRSDILTTLTSSAASFQIATVINVFEDVILAYENASAQLVVIRKDDDGDPSTTDGIKLEILATAVQIARQTRREAIRFQAATLLPQRETAPPGERIAEILLVPNRGGGFGPDQDLQLFTLREDAAGNITGKFNVYRNPNPDVFPFDDRNLAGTIIDDVGSIPNNDEPSNQIFGFVPFEAIRTATDSFDLDIFEFLPATIPSSNSLLIFDEVTLNFVEVTWDRNPASGEIDLVSGSTLFTEDGQVAVAVQQDGVGDLEVDFERAVVHGSAPLLLVFDEESNNMVSLDFSRDFVPGSSRLSLFSPSTNITLRRDTLGGVDPEQAALEPAFSFGTGQDLRNESLLIFDRNPDELLTMHYNTGTYVVLLKQADLASATGILGISDLTFFEPLDDDTLLTFDTEGSALLKVRIRYAAFPISFPTRF